MTNRTDDKPPTTIPVPLVAIILCGHCGSSDNHVGAVVPGYIVQCPECKRGLEDGIVIKCSGCTRMSCADCIYRVYLGEASSMQGKPA